VARPEGGVPVSYQSHRAQTVFLLDLLGQLEERCDGEPHCHACVFCGAMKRGEHLAGCP
jgi:hypothetical protein